jgi:SAM-dependent methyltransferase
MTYLPRTTLDTFKREFSARYPSLVSALWLQRPGADSVVDLRRSERKPGTSIDAFRLTAEQGSAQTIGISRLLELATGVCGVADLRPGYRLLDVLGGSGTLVRVARQLPRWQTRHNWILTADPSALLVQQALDYGLPALRQPAQFLLCADRSFDAVLLAYGTHHIPVPERPECYAEAYRVLRPGGRLVVHDFEIGSPEARWFSEVVAGYSLNGHDYTHVSRDQLDKDLRAAGFGDVELEVVYDPIRVQDSEPRRARDRLRDYMLGAYRLSRPGGGGGIADSRAWVGGLIASCLLHDQEELAALGRVPAPVIQAGGLAVYETPAAWIAELPRLALVATATKST